MTQKHDGENVWSTAGNLRIWKDFFILILQRPLQNKLQATKRYINRSSWYLFHDTSEFPRENNYATPFKTPIKLSSEVSHGPLCFIFFVSKIAKMTYIFVAGPSKSVTYYTSLIFMLIAPVNFADKHILSMCGSRKVYFPYNLIPRVTKTNTTWFYWENRAHYLPSLSAPQGK